MKLEDHLTRLGADSIDAAISCTDNEPPGVEADRGFIVPIANTVVAVSGQDAQSFLNNQFTNTVPPITELRGSWNAWCDPNGRVLFMPYLLSDGERYLCLVPKDLIDAFVKRLSMFVLRANVVIENASDRWSAFGIYLTADDPPIDELDNAETADDDSITKVGELLGQRLNKELGSSAHRYLVVAPRESIDRVAIPSATPASLSDAWLALDAAAGIPRVTSGNSGDFLPQQLNLDWLGVVSFDKGCYPGQEIIARLHYRGRAKQRLVVVVTDQSLPSNQEAGRLLDPDERDRRIGNLIDFYSIAGRGVGLAVVDIEMSDSGRKLAIDGAETALTVVRPPYWPDPDG